MSFSIEETVQAIDKLIDKGKVKNLSVSNFTVEDLKRALKVSRHGIALNEIPYNLIDRTYDNNGTVKFCEENGIAILCCRSLALGRLCGLQEDLESPVLIKALCDKYKKTSAQISLNWLLNKSNFATIIKSENPANIRENVSSLEFKMSAQDYKKLDNFHEDFLLSATGTKVMNSK